MSGIHGMQQQDCIRQGYWVDFDRQRKWLTGSGLVACASRRHDFVTRVDRQEEANMYLRCHRCARKGVESYLLLGEYRVHRQGPKGACVGLPDSASQQWAPPTAQTMHVQKDARADLQRTLPRPGGLGLCPSGLDPVDVKYCQGPAAQSIIGLPRNMLSARYPLLIEPVSVQIEITAIAILGYTFSERRYRR